MVDNGVDDVAEDKREYCLSLVFDVEVMNT